MLRSTTVSLETFPLFSHNSLTQTKRMEDNTWFDNAVSLMSAQLIGDKRQDVSRKGTPFDIP